MELVFQSSTAVTDRAGKSYVARVYGEPDEAGLWHGWIVFHPESGGGALATGSETSQPNLAALSYWASGLEPTYLDGALTRAIERQPKQVLDRLRKRIDADAAIARAEAGYFERAAEDARRRAEEAERERRKLDKSLKTL